jgi:YHS domain-containing protein
MLTERNNPMKKSYFFIMILIISIVVFSQMVRAQDASSDVNATAEITTAQDVGNQICPVSGETIDAATKATYEYDGKIYNFCCPMCIDEFKADPDKYIAKVNEELTTKAETL